MVDIAHVLLQLDPSQEVLVASETGELNVAVLLSNVLLQGVLLDGLELAMVAVYEQPHVLGLRVRLQPALPLGLVGAHVAAEHDL